MSATDSRKTMRVRTDALRVGDLIEYREYGTRARCYSEITALEHDKRRTSGGATVTRWTIRTADLLPSTSAPHAKHTVQRAS